MGGIMEYLNYLEQSIKNPLLLTLFISIAFDIITGTLKAIAKGVANSSISKNGISKHIGIVLLVMLVIIIFKPLEMESLINTVIIFYISSYILSILENLSLLGIPFPQWLKERFSILRSDNDEIKRTKK
jgi:toxin secretion/phage lysis holin